MQSPYITRARLFSVAVLFATLTPTQGMISMIVDINEQTVAFTGSDSGDAATIESPIDPFDPDSELVFEVEFVDWGLGTGFSDALNVNAMFVEALGGISDIDLIWSGSNMFLSTTSFDEGAFDTITTTGATPISYSGRSTGFINAIESLPSSLPLTLGTGYSPIAVSVVPEPSSYALGLGMTMLAIITLRRRLGTKHT